MGYERDVVIVGGCGHVGLPLGLAFADRGLRVALFDIDKDKVAMVNDAGQLPADEPGALRRCSTASSVSCLDASSRPGGPQHGRARRRSSSARRSTSTSPPTRRPSRQRSRSCADYFRDGQLLVLRSTVYPGVDRLGRAARRALAQRRRRVVLPGADRRGQGHGGAVRAAADRRRPATRTRSSGPPSCSRASHRRSCAGAGGGRARQALHQHVALHQVRGGQPAVHDRQRLRLRLRAHPPGAGPRLPAGRRHARRRARRRSVPAQGHDAARRVQQQQLHARATPA